MLFSEKIKFVRKKLYLSKTALAKTAGASFPTINRWENGHTIPNLVLQAKFEDFCKENDIQFTE